MHSLAPGTQVLRIGRRSIPGQVYLVTAATHERRHWFAHPCHASAAKAVLEDPESWPHAVPIAWVLMTDHLHLMIELGHEETLGMAMARIKSAIWHRIRACCGDRAGRLWLSSFHDHALRQVESLRKVGRYLLANPVAAGLVKRPQDWPWRGGTMLEAIEAEVDGTGLAR